MTERCPLIGMAWNTDIPEVCREQCEVLWETAIHDNNTDGEYDVFPSYGDCKTHEFSDLDGSDISLQGGTLPRSSLRIISVTDSCSDCGEEYGAQSYQFHCPYN